MLRQLSADQSSRRQKVGENAGGFLPAPSAACITRDFTLSSPVGASSTASPINLVSRLTRRFCSYLARGGRRDQKKRGQHHNSLSRNNNGEAAPFNLLQLVKDLMREIG